MALRLGVYAAVLILGLAIAYSGTRLLTGQRARENRSAFSAFGVACLGIGILVIFMGVRMIAQVQHDARTAVSPTSYLNLNASPAAAPSKPPEKPTGDNRYTGP